MKFTCFLCRKLFPHEEESHATNEEDSEKTKPMANELFAVEGTLPRSHYVTELCSHCNFEVTIADNAPSLCPVCGSYILPCAACDGNCTGWSDGKCNKFPYREEELITLFADGILDDGTSCRIWYWIKAGELPSYLSALNARSLYVLLKAKGKVLYEEAIPSEIH